MKKFCAFLLILLVFTAMQTFVIEKGDLLGLSSSRPPVKFVENDDGTLNLTWTPLPYPCFYRVETLIRTTGIAAKEPRYHYVADDFAVGDTYPALTTAIPMYYRVSAYGLFGRISAPGETIINPRYREPLKPTPISRYKKENPASLMPFLLWHVVPTAVCYELEILSDIPEKEGGTTLSKRNSLFSTRQIFTNGYQADLRPFKKYRQLYWRVRALGLHHEPIGEFSAAEPIFVDARLSFPDAPLINDFDLMPHFEQPLYPVYEWIPLNGQSDYEVELVTKPPVGDTEPTAERVWYKGVSNASTCYDEYARPWAGDYYWRVRAVDKNGKTIGRWSKAAKFTVAEHYTRITTAIFGDSITHGGGAVSYPPSSLEYSYGTYLDFPVINLGRSGDTSHTSLERFDTDVLPWQPMNLLILMGSNSLRAEDISANDIIDDLTQMRNLCEQNDIRPIFLTLMPINPANIAYAFQAETDPQWHDKLNIVNDFIRSQRYYIDLEPYFYDESRQYLDSRLSIDGLHPDIRGKMLMGEIVNLHKNVLR